MAGKNNELSRRRYVAITGLASVGGLAGCLGFFEDDGGEEPDTNGDDGTVQQPTDNSSDDGTEVNTTEDSDSEETEAGPDWEDPRNLVHFCNLDTAEPPYLDGSAATFSGTGDDIVGTYRTSLGMFAVCFEHGGQREFTVTATGLGLRGSEKIVSERGPVSGAVAIPAANFDVEFEVLADGDWKLVAAQPDATNKAKEPPLHARGTGNSVIGPARIDDQVQVSFEHLGSSSFRVDTVPTVASSTGQVAKLVTETGETSGTNLASPDVNEGWFNVVADGEWKIEIR